MDADPYGNGNFYDEIASFLPQPEDYNLDDLDEILRVTDSHLDSSLDFSAFDVTHVPKFEAPKPRPSETNDYHIDFSAYPSPANTHQSACTTPPYGSSQSQRSSSISSVDGNEHFNPDELMNFFADDDVKMDDFSRESVMKMQQRNTPSPTGSCSSSGGSSTSGVQSDVSSVASMPQTPRLDGSAYFADHQSGVNSIEKNGAAASQTTAESTLFAAPSAVVAVTPAAVLPIAVPVVLPLIQPISVPARTIVPIKALPLSANVRPLAAVTKIEPKLAPKSTAAQPVKIATPAQATVLKVTPSPSVKPKTIYLSSNDFKALMQKMNTGGVVGKGAKITGGFNGQMPKIIMKTPNGKVIAANKIVPPLGPKMVKTNGGGPLLVKHHQHQQQQQHKYNVAAAVAARAHGSSGSSSHSSCSSSGSNPDLTVYKGTVDEKIMKKQQRMIKNRESASLSRKKKKEYVVSLETRINNLEKENYTLKGENSSLRSQLMAFAQTCQCKHSNISEFILNSLNVNAGAGEQQQAPRGRSLKQRMSAATVRKNVAILFAMAFMVTLNVGNFQSFLNKNAIESSLDNAAVAAAATDNEVGAASGRHLLWVESESEFKEKQNRSKRASEMEVPPLHFLRPANRTSVGQRDQRQNGTAREPPPLAAASKCTDAGGGGGTANQTENMRLVNDLQKWIDGNDYLNLSLHEKPDNDLAHNVGFKVSPDYMEWKSLELQPHGSAAPTGGKQKRKFYLEPQQFDHNRKQRKFNTATNDNRNSDSDSDSDSHSDSGSEQDNSLDVFKPKLSDEYVRLFKGIKRQDDTFYVLSFNMDHILLPASVYNKSARPKMSLMLPAGDPSLNGDIVLMQIDCEVINTTEVKLKSDIIPERLRPLKYKAEPQPNDVASNETRAQQSRGNVTMPATAAREKPLAKTYFMVGPRPQTSAAASGSVAGAVTLKKKPIIVKLSGNETSGGLANIVSLNVKNSTLFAKMRETVEADSAP